MSVPKGKIVITGGAGFVGSQLGYYLANRGYDVPLVDNFSYGHLDNLIIDGKTFGRFIARDVRDASMSSLMVGADTVFHFAGVAALPVCQSNPQMAYDVNTSAVGNILELARLHGVRRVVFSSTSAVYENTLKDSLAEDDPVAPNLIYAMTKHAAEQICKSFAENYGMDIIVTRFFNLYGPHQDIKRTSPPFTSYIARELAAGRSAKLFNKTDAKRDYLYVSDVISLMEKMIHSPRQFRANIFNVGSGKSYSVPELYNMMKVISGKALEAEYGDPQQFWDSYPALFQGDQPLKRERIVKEVYKSALADMTKTSREFDWTARVGIEKGLREVYLYALAVK